MPAHLPIALATTAVTILLAVVAKVPTYRVAPVFLVPILWTVYFARGVLNLRPVHFALFAIALILHNLGALGWYQKWPVGDRFPAFSYDILVHFYFAFAGAFVLFRAMEHNVPALRPWQVFTATFFFMMGFAAIHELVEYLSTLLLGERGMLKTTGYVFDTQRDLTNNLLGTSLALACIALGRRLRRPTFSDPSAAPPAPRNNR